MNLLSYLSPQLIAAYHSKINGEIKIIESFGRYAIYVGGAPQSGAEITPMWDKVIKRVHSSEFIVQSCLVLGIGGGDVIKIIRKHYKDAEIIGVDNDPVMIEIAKKYFGLGEISKCKIVISDASDYIKKINTIKFDLIVVDLFIGKLNPLSSRGRDFLLGLKRVKATSGIIIYNSHYQEDNSGEFERFKNTYKLVFPQVEEIFAYRNNRVVKLKSHV